MIYTLVIALSFIFSADASADSYSKSSGMNGMGQTQTWISGMKKRDETAVEMQGLPANKNIQITRVDKNVVWTVDDTLKAYEEAPIFTPAKSAQSDESFDSAHRGSAPTPGEDGPSCNPQVTISPQKQMIAGYETTGYTASGCPQIPATTFWIAPAQGKLKNFEKDRQALEKGYRDVIYQDVPASERKQMEAALQLLGQAMAAGMMGLDVSKLPKNSVALRMEQANPEGGPPNVMVHMLEINDAKASPELFEIPPGYRKVDSLVALQSQQMMRQMGLGNGMGDLQQYSQQLPQEESAPSGTGSLSAEPQNPEPEAGETPREESAPAPDVQEQPAEGYYE